MKKLLLVLSAVFSWATPAMAQAVYDQPTVLSTVTANSSGSVAVNGIARFANASGTIITDGPALMNSTDITLRPYGTLPGNTTQLKFQELVANGTDYVAFRAADSLALSTVWTLPVTDGTLNQILATDGAGDLFWTSVAAVSGAWGLTGNTAAPTDFIGTNNAQDFLLKGQGASVLSLNQTGAHLLGEAATSKALFFDEAMMFGSNYVALKAPDSLGSNVTFTLPAADGTSGQVLSTDGAGNLSFSSSSANDWTLVGNAGTNPATNFIGTTDAQDFVIRTNNTPVIYARTNGFVKFPGQSIDSGNDALSMTIVGGDLDGGSWFNGGYIETYGPTALPGLAGKTILHGTAMLFRTPTATPAAIDDTGIIIQGIGASSRSLFIREGSANGAQSVILSAPGSLPADVPLTLPSTVGTAGQALVTDGTGVLSFSSTTAGEWHLTGNTGTNPATQFVGTADLQPLNIKANSTTGITVRTNGRIKLPGGFMDNGSDSGSLTLVGGDIDGGSWPNGAYNELYGTTSGMPGANILHGTNIFFKTPSDTPVIIGDTGITINGAASVARYTIYKEATNNGSNFIAMKAPDAVTADVTFTLPGADGAAGSVLTTSGTGVLSFSPVSSLGGWGTTGNSGTNVTSNFVGTTDNNGLRFRTNNATFATMSTDKRLSLAGRTAGPDTEADIDRDVDTGFMRLWGGSSSTVGGGSIQLYGASASNAGNVTIYGPGTSGTTFQGSSTTVASIQESTGVSVLGAAATSRLLRFSEAFNNGGDVIAFKAPDSLAGSTTWTLPGADGGANTVMKTDGAGNLAFASLNSIGGWTTSGNTGTNPASNFVGTADNVNFVIKANSATGIIVQPNQYVSFPGQVIDIGSDSLTLNLIGGNANGSSYTSYIELNGPTSVSPNNTLVHGENIAFRNTAGTPVNITNTAMFINAFGTTGRPIRFKEGTNTGSNFVSLQAPDVLAADVAWKLPATDGSSGTVLTTDGAGNLSFTSSSANDWRLLGNSGTNAATNFVGTTDAQALSFRTNNALFAQMSTDKIMTMYGNANPIPLAVIDRDVTNGTLRISGGTDSNPNNAFVQMFGATATLGPYFIIQGGDPNGIDITYPGGDIITNFTSSAGLTMWPAAGSTRQMRFRELIANGANYVGFRAAAALAGDVMWTLPAAEGTAGQLMSTNGAGTLSFASTAPLDWHLAGNGGTTPGTHFIGTTDAQDVVFKRNNAEVGRFSSVGLELSQTELNRGSTTNSFLLLAGGTSTSGNGVITLFGSTAATPGQININGTPILLRSSSGTEIARVSSGGLSIGTTSTGSGASVLSMLGTGTTPSAVAGVGILYVTSAGALRYRGPTTNTLLANP